MPIKCIKAVNIYPNIVLCFIEILKIWLPLKGLLILKSKKANIKKIVTPKWVSDMFSSLFYLHQCSLIFQFEHCTFLPSQHLYFVLLGVCVIILAIEYKLLIWDKKNLPVTLYDQDWWAPKCVDRYLRLYTFPSCLQFLKKWSKIYWGNCYILLRQMSGCHVTPIAHFPYESWLQKIVQERRMQMRIWNINF